MHRAQLIETLLAARQVFAVWILFGMAWMASAPAHAVGVGPAGSTWFWLVGMPAMCWLLASASLLLRPRTTTRRVQALRVR